MLGLHGGIQFRQVRALPNMDNIDRHGYRPTYGSVLDVSVGLEKDVDKARANESAIRGSPPLSTPCSSPQWPRCSCGSAVHTSSQRTAPTVRPNGRGTE